jgi:trimeric autotransporter adhesin
MGFAVQAGAAVPYYYLGANISDDGNSITGGEVRFDATRGAGTWTGKRIAGNGPPRITGISNAASGATGQVAPGQLVSIYANAAVNALGPKEGAGMKIEDGKASTSISGVTVEFMPIGALAPLTYVSAGQINAIVPYEVSGLSQVQVRVHFNGRSSEPFAIRVGASELGIFTANGSGTGLGAILNYDGTQNSTTRKAARGSVIVLYLTGAGQTTPPGESGKVTVPLSSEPYTPQPLTPIAVRINGESARIAFYGEAPGLVSGVVQLNVEVPLAISAGMLPVSVIAGGRSTPEGVTVAVE